MSRPFRSILDTVRARGLSPEALRRKARVAEANGYPRLGEIYQDEAEAQEVARSQAVVCDLCGGSGRVADDRLCWRCEPERRNVTVREVRRAPTQLG